MAEDIDKDKDKEAGAGQPPKPEVSLTPDQQQNLAEKADASAAAAAGGPKAGLGELADARDAAGGGPEEGLQAVSDGKKPLDSANIDYSHLSDGFIKTAQDGSSLVAIGGGIVESMKPAAEGYKKRIEAVVGGHELTPGDKDNLKELMRSYQTLGGEPFDLSASGASGEVQPSEHGGDEADVEGATPVSSLADVPDSGGEGGQPPNGSVTGESADGGDGDDKDSELGRLAGNLKNASLEKTISDFHEQFDLLYKQPDKDQILAVSEPDYRAAYELYASRKAKDEVGASSPVKPENGVVEPVSAPPSPEPAPSPTTPEREPAPTVAPVPEPEPSTAPTTETETDDEGDPYSLADLDVNDLTEISTQINNDLQRIATMRTVKQNDESQREFAQREDALLRKRDAVDAQKRSLKKDKKGSKEEQDEKRRKLRADAEETARINSLPLVEHEVELNKSKDRVAYLKGKLGAQYALEPGSRDQEEIKILESELSSEATKSTSLESVFEKKKNEDETNRLEEENAKAVEQARERDRNLSNVTELQGNIETTKIGLTDLNDQIFKLEENIEKLDKDDPERKDLNKQKIELSKKAERMNKALGLDENALEKAQERAQAEDTGDFSRENVKTMPISEFLGLKTDGRADHLAAVSETIKMPSVAEAHAIEARMRNNEPISIDERAQMTLYYKDKFVRYGRKSMFSKNGVDIKAFNEMANHYPDVARATMNKVLENDAIKAQIQERFGSNWSKLIDYVKKNPAMFLLLLAMLGIGTAAVAAGPASTAIGLGKFAMR